MQILDKFLKILRTDRNTFFTYILTLISLYILVDRVVEMLFIFFSGISLSYWGPIRYTLALACVSFAFLFSGNSSFCKNDKTKISFLYTYIVILYTIVVSMVVQWVNEIGWILLMSVPNYVGIVTTSSELIRPAFSMIALYIPLVTFFSIFEFIYMKLNDSGDIKDAILDFKGISLAPAPNTVGPYTCENQICINNSTGKPVKIPEIRRFQSLLIVGPSGTGKTTMLVEPMIANDIAKKLFFQAQAKEMGFIALKTGLATISTPYSNEYLNKHFNLNMLIPVEGKLKVYKAYMKKLILNSSSKDIKYKNLGLTAISPDYESTSKMMKIADNFNIPYNIVDPNDPNSVGINPFVFDDPLKTAVAISSVLKSMYDASSHTDVDEAFRANVTTQAIENLSILLKLVYPKMHDGDLPNLNDLLEMLMNFDIVENMARKLEENEELAEKYKVLLTYLKKNFYSGGSGRKQTEQYIYSATTQLDNLLRNDGINRILCNRENNINFDKALEDGEFTFVCTRRGDLGNVNHKAFGLFFLILMEYSVLRRPGTEDNRIPHFLYIDEFPEFVSKEIDAIFTLYRKYHVATTIVAQNLSQLGEGDSSIKSTILSNCSNKIIFGGATPEDREWWTTELGNKRKWKWKSDYNPSTGKYDSKMGGIEYGWTANFQVDKLGSLKAKQCAYKILGPSGERVVGQGKLSTIDSKFKSKQKIKFFNFAKYTGEISETEDNTPRKKKWDFGHMDFTDPNNENEIDPIKTDDSDSNFLYDNGDAVIVNLKKGNSN